MEEINMYQSEDALYKIAELIIIFALLYISGYILTKITKEDGAK